MHKIHQFLGIMLTLFMLGSSSGIASIPVADTQDFANDGAEVSLDTGAGDTQSPDNEAAVESPELPPTSDPETDPATEVVDVADVPEDSGSEANPSTGPPADEPVVDEPVADEPVVDEPAVDEPVVEEPVVDEPAVEEPVVDEPVVEEPVVDEPIVDEPIIDEPVVDEPVVDEPAEVESEEDDNVVADDSVESESASTPESDPEVSIQAVKVPVVIQVQDRDFNPISGATVVITDYEGDITYGSKNTVNGQATFELDEGDEYYATVTATGYFKVETYQITVSSEYPGDITTITLDRDQPGTFTMTVLDIDTGKPIEGAVVALTDIDDVSQGSGKTNADGVFTSPKVLDGGSIYFTVSADGYTTNSGSAWIDGNTVYEYEFFLWPIVGGDVSFKVYDFASENEAPLANVSVTIESWDDLIEPKTGKTKADGTISFLDLPGGSYTATFTLDGFQVREETVHLRGDYSTTIAMYPGPQPGKLTIITQDFDGLPLNNATIIVKDDKGKTVASGKSIGGKFTTGTLQPDGYDVVITLAGYHDFEVTNVGVNGDFSYTARLQKVITGTFTLEVVDGDTNKPVSGAKVTVSHDSLAKDLVLTTNANGIVTFQATSLGTYDIDVTKDGFTTNGGLYTYMGPEKQQIHIRALRPGKAIITVRDADTNKLLSGVKIEIFGGPKDDLVYAGTTNASGKIVTGVLPEDGYVAHMTKDGYFAISPTFSIAGDNEMTFYMETEKSGVLTVQALDPVDAPIAGAKVFVYEAIVDGIVPGDGNIGVRYVPGKLIMSGTTNADGRVTTGVLGSGSYLVYVEANGFKTSSGVVHMNGDYIHSVDMVAGTSTPVDPTNPGEPGVTPTPGETPTPGQTPTPGETPTPGTPGGGDDDDDQPGNSTTGVLSVGLALCTDAGCDTQYDGYSVTWTVTPLQTAATDEIDASRMAAVGMTSAPVSLAAMQQAQSFSITAVIQDGMAVGTSGEIQIGSYNVCLNPVITGPNGETATIADGAICSDVDVTSAGNILLPFSGVAGAIDAGEPTEVPAEGESGSGEPTSPSVPGEEGTAQSGGDTATDTSASAGSVDKLPNTGTGSQSGQSHGFMVVTLLVLLIGTSAIGRKRFHRA